MGLILALVLASFAAQFPDRPCLAVDAEQHPCVTPAAPPKDAVAVLDGEYILLPDLDKDAREGVERLPGDVAEARRQALRLEVEALLVDTEAARRKVAAKDLHYAELEGKLVSPSDEEVKAELEVHPDKYPKDPERARSRAAWALTDARLAKLREELVARLSREMPVAYGADPSAPGLQEGTVLATVGARKLTYGDLRLVLDTAAARASLFPWTRETAAVAAVIRARLAKPEAARRGITVEELTRVEVTARVAAEPNTPKRQIEEAFDNKLREGHTMTMLVTAPVFPRQSIATAGCPSRGDAAAPVTLVEFGDFECPPCGQMWLVVEEALKGYERRVRYVFRQRPLRGHSFAAKSAEASLAAHAQGKFFDYAHVLFTHQDALDIASLKKHATAVGLDRARFDADLDAGRFAADVRQDVREADRQGVVGTPSFFVNGERVPVGSFSVEGLRAEFERAIERVRAAK